MPQADHLLLAFAVSIAVASIAHMTRSLSRSGYFAAIPVGTFIVGYGGWAWGAVLFAFFVSCSLLSKCCKRSGIKEAEKGSERDAIQVLANGSVPAAAAVFSMATESAWALPLFLGSMAAVTADTWATELGGLSRRQPIIVTTLKPCVAGESGGITLIGCIASALAAAFIALIWAFSGCGWTLKSILAVVATGLAASLFDSVLGATLQVRRRCDICGELTEQSQHCDAETQYASGLRWMTNDTVNFCASLFGGIGLVALEKVLHG